MKNILYYYHDSCGIGDFYLLFPLFDALRSKYKDDNITLLSTNSIKSIAYNKKWFDAAIPYFTSLWDTVVKERESGYHHRRPKKHNKPPPIKSPLTPQNNACMPIPNLALPPPKMILKIRSPSFDSIN